MSEVLRRKLARAQQPEEAPHALVDQAWRLALARALREGAGLAAETNALSSRQCGLDDLPELPPEQALIALLDGPGGAMGMAAFAPELTASLIEMQTIGRVGNGPAVTRRPTRTDAAMVSPILDRALARFDFLVRDLPQARIGQGFRFASLLEDSRSIGLLLDDLDYHLQSVTLTLGEGGRSGEVLLALPLGFETNEAVPLPAAARQPDPTQEFVAGLNQSHCELVAVLGHRVLPLSEVMQLEPGQVLTLDDAAITRISLRGIDGKPVAMARLGQQDGNRALRLSFVAGSEANGLAATEPPAALAEAAYAPADGNGADMDAPFAPSQPLADDGFGPGDIGQDFRATA
ncbi:flagellar motor switch protein FliM [Xinfangfangia sp. D13-10-4-6]|uniref:FliM/FliN family flagellar motor C-terminal domain-containing protein n=1 Tax=Pseudogemmobacter hezensis TaxID=2737662 RepID=UPI0015562D33|nr:FliM/FliN family flagellar motor C-terminal domain-containing protein [Pseudogemmobacter hezensis]NPD15820.1 flagellar motor switch protein FliM [Pseudogemmobacter hezensis]